jgi:phage tail protein X
MLQFMHTVRFFVGMAMLAGGVALAQPFVAAVVAARGQATASRSSAAVPGVQPGLPAMAIGSGAHAIPDPRHMDSLGVSGLPLTAGDQFLAAPAPPMPPTPMPPTRLPASGMDSSPASPALDGTYRSTVEIPPPPLLDFHAPPPLSAGWSAHDVARPAAQSPAVQPASVPADYVVRDGDDLTAIALKVNGHAGAAPAIWAANRDRITDPQLLPIGLALRLPPTWTLPAAHTAQGGMSGLAIEPTFTPNWSSGHAKTSPGREPDAPAAHGGAEAFWLQNADARPSAPAATPTAGPGRLSVPEATSGPAVPAHRPATVRVGMGDSLESIAVRFYGDRVMASHIWQANRDRLRSPDLLVPGAELRLP